MAEELSVVLRRTNESVGLGFSLLGTAGLPPIIYDIVENSPAAESGEVSGISLFISFKKPLLLKPLLRVIAHFIHGVFDITVFFTLLGQYLR